MQTLFKYLTDCTLGSSKVIPISGSRRSRNLRCRAYEHLGLCNRTSTLVAGEVASRMLKYVCSLWCALSCSRPAPNSVIGWPYGTAVRPEGIVICRLRVPRINMAGQRRLPVLTRLGVHTYASDNASGLLPENLNPIPAPNDFLKRPDVKVSHIRCSGLLLYYHWSSHRL